MNNNNNTDLQQDSGLYLQEFVLGLENLPSEIKHHFAEIRNTLEQTKTAEKRISVAQYDLQSIHRQWFNQELEKRKKLLKHEPDLIKRIKNDYNKLEDLSTERIQLAEDSIKLLDRHLNKLSHDLDLHEAAHPELVSAAESRTFTIPHNRKRSLSVDESQDEESDMLDEQEYQTMLDNRNQKRKKREAREATDQSEPLYCFCQQVSYGEMVACDGENCPYEWFHMDCVGLDEPPKGAWYCDHCLGEIHQNKKSSHLSILKKRKKDA